MREPLQSMPGNPANPSRISAIAETVLPGPAAHSMVQGEFHNYVRSGAVDRLTSYELVGYMSEGLLQDIKRTGDVNDFITRYRNIRQTPPPNPKGAAEHNENLDRAEEIIAVSFCEVNDRLIERLEARQQTQLAANPGAPMHDQGVANMLRRVNRELMPAYQRATAKMPALAPAAPLIPHVNIRQRMVMGDECLSPQEVRLSQDDIGIKGNLRGDFADGLRSSLQRHSFSGNPRYGSGKSGNTKTTPERIS